MQIAANGIRKAMGQLTSDAQVVASSIDPASDGTIHALIDARQQLLYTQAGARMISSANQMMSSLLDVRA